MAPFRFVPSRSILLRGGGLLVLAGSLCARTALAEDKPAPAPAVTADGAAPMTAGERDRATQVAELLDGMARDAVARGDLELARLSLAKLLEFQVALLGENDASVGITLTRLAQCHVRLDNPFVASMLYGRALAIQEQAAAGDRLQLKSTLLDMARLYRSLGQKKLAQDLAARAAALPDPPRP